MYVGVGQPPESPPSVHFVAEGLPCGQTSQGALVCERGSACCSSGPGFNFCLAPEKCANAKGTLLPEFTQEEPPIVDPAIVVGRAASSAVTVG